MKRTNLLFKFVLFCLAGAMPLFAYDFKVTVLWDELAMEGEAEAILQYYHDGQVEIIRGSLNKPSSDGNIIVNRTNSGGSQEFIITKAAGKLVNIWVANILMDEDFATKDDYLMLANSKAKVFVEDNLNHRSYQVTIPPKMPGLVFRGGAIVDGAYYGFLEMYQQQRIYTVTLINATTGKALANANVLIKERRTGETVAMGVTDESGYFAQKLDYGKYTATFTKEGFITANHQFQMDISELPVSMNFALSPIIKKFRIVLTWGPFPRDLDAHLTGPKPEGGFFHIWWNQKTLIGGKNFLDRDDTDQYGPETITIYKPAQGEYTYAVHDYSGRNRRNSLDLSMSGARVDVYAEGGLQQTFIVPPGQRGNVWQVFKIDTNQRIIPVNQMYDESVSSRVFH